MKSSLFGLMRTVVPVENSILEGLKKLTFSIDKDGKKLLESCVLLRDQITRGGISNDLNRFFESVNPWVSNSFSYVKSNSAPENVVYEYVRARGRCLGIVVLLEHVNLLVDCCLEKQVNMDLGDIRNQNIQYIFDALFEAVSISYILKFLYGNTNTYFIYDKLSVFFNLNEQSLNSPKNLLKLAKASAIVDLTQKRDNYYERVLSNNASSCELKCRALMFWARYLVVGDGNYALASEKFKVAYFSAGEANNEQLQNSVLGNWKQLIEELEKSFGKKSTKKGREVLLPWNVLKCDYEQCLTSFWKDQSETNGLVPRPK